MRATRTALGLAVSLSFLTASAAHAGTYDVLVCDAANGIGGGNLALSLGVDSDKMTNETHCPTNGADTGVVNRTRLNKGPVNPLHGAHGTFTAPPGTTVTEIFWRGGFSRASCHWGAGIAAGGELRLGMSPEGNDCGFFGWTYTDEVQVPINAQSFQTAVRCGNFSGCGTGSGGSLGWNGYQAAMRTHSMRIRVDDPTPPAVGGLGGGLASGGWVRGSQSVTFNATDGAGIFFTRLRVDGTERDSGLRACDYRRPAPCSDVSDGGYTFNTAGLADGEHRLTVEAVDAGGNLGTATATLRSDNTPPARPTGLVVGGGDGWRGSNAFDLSWSNPGGQHAPIVAAHYSICPAGELENCTRGSAAGDAITKLSGIQVPAPGDWALRVWLEDAAGNADEQTASDPVHLRFDDLPPEIVFQSRDPNDPRRVTAALNDPASGPAGGAIEVSRDGSGTWRALPTTLENGQLVAYVDDERLRDGRYLLRAQASDNAGNSGIGDRRADGTQADLMLPLRVATILRTGVPVTVKKRVWGRGRPRTMKKLVGRKRVRYGRTVAVEGRLTNRDGQPVVGQQLTVYGRSGLPGADFAPLGTVTTNDRGRFRYRADALYSVRVRIHYLGTALIRPTSNDAVLLVPGRVSLKPSRKRALNGQRVVFRGRFHAPENLDAGKVVELQAQVGKNWRTFATARTDDSGRYAVRYRFKSTTGRVTYRFRARLPKERAFPYEQGRSRVKTVVVRGR